MKRNKWLYMLMAVVLIAACLFCVYAIADAGNFSGGSDYGGGGGWSSGGSDWSSGSSDWGSSSGGVFFLGGSGQDGASAIAIIFIVLFLVLFAVGRYRRSAAQGAGNVTYSHTANLSPISSLIQKDPNFSEAAMKEKISNLYVRMQNAWQAGDFTPMRPHMTDALYNQFARQLNELVRAGNTNFVERIAVLDVSLDGWASDEANDKIVATVSTRIVDYTVNNASGRVVSGSKTAEKFMVYRWELIRSAGMKTPERAGSGRDGTVEISCPSCGAPVEINQSAKCPYCGSIINAKDYDWSVSAISGISQRTVGR